MGSVIAAAANGSAGPDLRQEIAKLIADGYEKIRAVQHLVTLGFDETEATRAWMAAKRPHYWALARNLALYFVLTNIVLAMVIHLATPVPTTRMFIVITVSCSGALWLLMGWRRLGSGRMERRLASGAIDGEDADLMGVIAMAIGLGAMVLAGIIGLGPNR
jgi:hypothetical protein